MQTATDIRHKPLKATILLYRNNDSLEINGEDKNAITLIQDKLYRLKEEAREKGKKEAISKITANILEEHKN